MGILIQTIDNEFCPVVICDICKQKIEYAERCIVLYNPRKKNKPFFVHKFTCDREHRQELNEKYQCWMQGDDFLVYLSNNLNSSPKKLVEHLKHMIKFRI